MRNIDNVEGDIDAPHLLRRFVGMDDSSGIGDLLGQRVDLFKRATGQADHRSFTDEGMSHCAADCASRSVNHGILVFKQQMSLPPVCLASLCVSPGQIAKSLVNCETLVHTRQLSAGKRRRKNYASLNLVHSCWVDRGAYREIGD